MKWAVQVAGEVYDLKELSKSLTDDDLRILERNGQYFLESNKLEMLNTSEEVASFISEVMPVLWGAARLALGGRTPLQIANITRVRSDGLRDISVNISVPIYSRATIDMKIIRNDGTTAVVNPANMVNGWIKLGFADQKVAKALRLFGKDQNDWTSFYRLYEVIEDDIGGVESIVSCGWATKGIILKIQMLKFSNKCGQ
jgi:hypothetical protein